MSLLFVSCGEQEKEITVQSIAISQPSAEMEIGEKLTLKATVSPSNASYDGLNWTSTNPKVASVSTSGLVTALSEGNTTITVMAGGKTASCAITVVKGFVAVTSINLNKTSLELVEGDSESLTATVLPDDATDKTVTWASSNEAVATVKDGKITAVKEGEANVSVKAGNQIASCKVIVKKKVIAVVSIELNKTEITLVEGDSETLTATVKPEDATDKTVTWSSSDLAVAVVEEGKITAVKEGKATIAAQAGNIIATCSIIVNRDTSNDAILFTDANFKAYCVENFDTNNDGELSYSEAAKVKAIGLNSEDIVSLGGIEFFSNLESLNCSPDYSQSMWSNSDRVWHLFDKDGNEIIGGLTTVDLSKNVLLTHLCISGNQLTTLDLSNNNALQYLDCSYNFLSSLDVFINTELTDLNCECNSITELDLSSHPLLKELICSRNQLDYLDLSNNAILKYLECSSNYLTALDLSNNTSLISLICISNRLTSLDLSMLPSLWRLRCVDNRLSSLDVSHNPSLKYLYCSRNQIASLDVSNNPVLSIFDCSHNLLQSLDVSKNLELKSLHCQINPLLTEIWLKTGQSLQIVYDTEVATIKYKD